MYIEPCCVDRQLPSLLRKNYGTPIFFQTSGDVTVARFMQAISSMVDAPFIMTLSNGDVDRSTLQTVRYYMQRNWCCGLLLVTQYDQTQLVKDVMGDYLSKVQYTCDTLIADGMLAFLGASSPHPHQADATMRNFLVMYGAMLPEKDFSLSLYTAVIGNGTGDNDDSLWSQAVAPVISKLRTKPLIAATDENIIAALSWR